MLAGSRDNAPLAVNSIECLKWSEKPFILWRSGTQYVAVVTKVVSSYCRAPLVEPYCKTSNISDKNWLRYSCLSYLIKICLSVWRHHLANLHIFKTWISLERKEIFENSKQHFILMQTACFCLKIALIWKKRFSS